ncbi:MAG: DNA methyltransferase [Candidatus Saccharimonadales bacterium]
MQTLCILGRQPAIGLAELESLYGAKNVSPLDDHAALVEGDVDFERLGSSIKCGEFITSIDSTNPQKVFDFSRKALPNYIADFPEGKIKLGVSMYGISMPTDKINANALSLKKAIRSTGRSVRVIPNTDHELSSAQTLHNALTSDLGVELLFVKDGTRTLIGRVSHVQDIDSYTLRDRGRPKRDAFVGMLPPKLAQTIINLAVGDEKEQRRRMKDDIVTILDPFCGTGVVLQEAALMGYAVYGTDISEKMVRYSRDNMNWAMEKFHLHTSCHYETADAMAHTWRQPIDFVAAEGYLGQPIGGQHPTPEKLQQIIYDSNIIMRGFLKNIAPQISSGTRLCIAAPAWHIDGTTHHLPMLDEIDMLGYNRVVFTYATNDELIYRRDDQPTGRELLVLVKK